MLVAALVLISAGSVLAIAAVERKRRRNRRAVSRWAASSRVSAVLGELLDPTAAVESVAHFLVPEFADFCTLHLGNPQGVRRAAAAHADPSIERQIRTRFAESPFVADAPHGPVKVIRTGQTDIVADVTKEVRDTDVADAELLKLSGARSWITVPLNSRHEIVGALTLARRTAHAYDGDDVEWTQDLARRVGLALENMRLYGEARELFEQTVSANYVSTPDGRMLACNQMFAELLGFESVEQVLATPAEALYTDPADRRHFVDELIASKRIIGRETTFKRHRDGDPVHTVENATGTFNDRGELVKITGFIVDRSAQKQLEERLRQVQRLEAVGQLAGGIAHDFNNLLTVIIGCADLMRSAEPVAVVDGHDPLEELTNAAKRAATLTQQLLAFSRRQVLQPRLVDLNEALRALHTMLRRLVRDKTVIMLDLDPGIARVRVDPGQLDQVIVNLIVNAADAMPEGGTVVLSTSNAVLTDQDVTQHPYVTPGDYVRVSVRDSGIGMDEATLARAFEPFFTTKAIGKGTGLGLSTVYGIVKQSGGYVWMASTPGAGTTVSIFLPAVRETELAGAAATTTPAR
jgi:PAS domain S-box-containing protein